MLTLVPWTTRRSNQSILKEISPGCSLEGLMLKLKLQYLGHLMRRADSLEKTLMLVKFEGRRIRGWQRMRWGRMASTTQWTWVSVDSGVGGGQGGLVCCGSWGHKESDMTEQLNWTELNWVCNRVFPVISVNRMSQSSSPLNVNFWAQEEQCLLASSYWVGNTSCSHSLPWTRN